MIKNVLEEEDKESIERKKEIQKYQLKIYQEKELKKKLERIKKLFCHVTIEEGTLALEECDQNEVIIIIKFIIFFYYRKKVIKSFVDMVIYLKFEKILSKIVKEQNRKILIKKNDQII
jgi:predicted ribosome-associated RNA-binding protein Tma20